MSPNNSSQNQSRFFTAVMLSLGVLLLWSYLFPPPKPDANVNANAETTQQQTATTAPDNNQPQQIPAGTLPNTAQDNIPNRVISVKTPLYEAKFDSRGALVTSWVLLQNRTQKGENRFLTQAAPKMTNILSN